MQQELSEAYGLAGVLFSDMPCSLHQNDIVKAQVIKPFLSTVSRMYDVCSLCNMGANFFRILNLLLVVVDRLLIIKKGEEPRMNAAEEALKAEIFNYVELHVAAPEVQRARRYEQGKLGHLRGQRRPASFVLDAWSSLLGFARGWFGDLMIHYCKDFSCCNGFTRRTTIAKLVKLLLATVFVSQPTSPELGKWTKFGPANDRLVLATLTFGVYGAAFSTAFGKQAADANNVRGDVVGDATYVREMHWHQLKGVRAEVACRFLNDRSELVKLCIFAVASEPFRMLMRIFFVYARSNPSAPGSGDAQRASPPPLTNFTSVSLSPITSLLQYVSSFISGDGSRSRRLWVLLGVLKLSD